MFGLLLFPGRHRASQPGRRPRPFPPGQVSHNPAAPGKLPHTLNLGRISDLRYHLTTSLHSHVHVRKGLPEKTPPENTPLESMPPEKTPPESMPPEGANMNSPR